VPEWQDVAVGDEVRLAPEVALLVAALEPGRSLVLRGGVPMGKTPPPDDFTWAFTLGEQPDFPMSQKMLGGIKDRAEGAAAPPRAAGRC
jgi:hypothetical protein